jgi:hypothetical protein
MFQEYPEALTGARGARRKSQLNAADAIRCIGFAGDGTAQRWQWRVWKRDAGRDAAAGEEVLRLSRANERQSTPDTWHNALARGLSLLPARPQIPAVLPQCGVGGESQEG